MNTIKEQFKEEFKKTADLHGLINADEIIDGLEKVYKERLKEILEEHYTPDAYTVPECVAINNVLEEIAENEGVELGGEDEWE